MNYWLQSSSNEYGCYKVQSCLSNFQSQTALGVVIVLLAGNNKIKKLKKYLRNIKLKHKEEKSFHIESLDKIRKESSVEREYKSRLQEELEQRVV